MSFLFFFSLFIFFRILFFHDSLILIYSFIGRLGSPPPMTRHHDMSKYVTFFRVGGSHAAGGL